MIGESNYRIKAIRDDGVYAYSNEVEVDLVNVKYGEPYRIYPNPVVDQITIYMPETVSTAVEFEVYTAAGIEVFRRKWGHPMMESPLEETVDVDEYIPGIYYYKITDGDRTYHGSFIVAN